LIVFFTIFIAMNDVNHVGNFLGVKGDGKGCLLL